MKLWKKCRIAWMIFLTIGISGLLNVLHVRSSVSFLTCRTCESMDFRNQALDFRLYERLKKEIPETAFSRVLTATMLEGKFYPGRLSADTSVYDRYKRKEFQQLEKGYRAVWADLCCFPVKTEDAIFYENTFGQLRTFGGNRIHEGTDIFGEKDLSGYYPVISMTSGVVEQVGWLPLGGYRVGIRSENGGYFYYAHLSGYSRGFQSGEYIEAGEILGFMGNTGYGPEGTAGAFPVHLHLGIYIRTPFSEEMSVNPYYVLRAAEEKTL